VLILDLNEFIDINSGGNGLVLLCTIYVFTALLSQSHAGKAVARTAMQAHRTV